MTPVFLKAVEWTMKEEGGWSDNPLDPGGATNHGITFTALKEAAAKLHGHSHEGWLDGEVTLDILRDLTPEQIEEVIMVDGYWPDAFDKIPPLVAIKTFDLGFNMGIRVGQKLLQTSVNRLGPAVALKVDGVLGSTSVSAINAANPTALLSTLVATAKSHYRDIAAAHPPLSTFLKGWLNRADRIPTAEYVSG